MNKTNSWTTARRKFTRILVPVAVGLGMVYFSWIYAQHICWDEVYYHHSRATAIGLIVGNCLLITLIAFIWAQLLVLGPGMQPKIPLLRLIEDENKTRTVDPPEFFFCDIRGFPVWCSTCETIKANRAHHSSNMKCCVARFDHYCIWIGGSIGRRNYRLFMQFMFWYFTYFVYIGVSSAAYVKQIRERKGALNGNVIVLFIADLFWLLMLAALFGTHIWYISRNIASIDDIIAKRHRRNKTLNDQFVNFRLDSNRYVLRVNPSTDFIWDKGFCNNWKEAMGENWLFWVVPWKSQIKYAGDELADTYEEIIGDYYEEISPKWRQVWTKRVKNNDYVSIFSV